jgi:AcrR family transcriptional regulator
MKPARKLQLHDNIREEIRTIAWKQVTKSGASSLSLGAIARELGVTTPALYRYYHSRNDLVTALIREAYLSFAQALESARDSFPAGDYVGHFRSLALAYYDWAAAHPQQYILIFGAPIPGYELDPQVGQVADRSFLVLLDVINAAAAADRINFDFEKPSISAGLKDQLAAEPANGKSYPPRVMYLALVSWSFIHGVASLELYQHYPGILAGRIREFIQVEIDRLIKHIGLE